MLVSIVIFVSGKGVFPQFSQELALDIEIYIASISGLTTAGA
ncbi:hypothetical protein Tco_0518536, partial [Tanacetum coccineum]